MNKYQILHFTREPASFEDNQRTLRIRSKTTNCCLIDVNTKYISSIITVLPVSVQYLQITLTGPFHSVNSNISCSQVLFYQYDIKLKLLPSIIPLLQKMLFYWLCRHWKTNAQQKQHRLRVQNGDQVCPERFLNVLQTFVSSCPNFRAFTSSFSCLRPNFEYLYLDFLRASLQKFWCVHVQTFLRSCSCALGGYFWIWKLAL